MTRIVLAVTGASGAAIGLRVAERLRALPDIETHLVLSMAAERTLTHEVDAEATARIRAAAHVVHGLGNIGASIASGSFATGGMLVVPCSMHSLAAIASGIADNLIVRAADVHLKEGRKLVLLTRETPLHLGHLRLMLAATEMGAVVAPPVPAYYRLPQSVDDIVEATASRAIDHLGLGLDVDSGRWAGLQVEGSGPVSPR